VATVVEGYTGRPGAGKTCSMVWAAWRLHKRGRRIRSNIPLEDRRPGSKTFGQEWTDGPRLRTLAEAMQEDNCLILLDEIHVWAPSQEWDKIPPEMKIWLAQHRKNGLDIWYTSQSSARVYNVIRELTATCWSAKRYGPLTVLEGIDPESKEKMGRRYQIISPQVYNLYDTAFMVGTADGRGAGRGQARRYGGEEFRVQMIDALVREEGPAAGARYRWARLSKEDAAEMPNVCRTAPLGSHTIGG
jgi:hypothetical protein